MIALPRETEGQAREILKRMEEAGLRLATAESCTGGLISAALTDIPGSSRVFDCGFSTYSNRAKMKFLSVPKNLLQEHGAVSEEVARAMAEGALRAAGVDVALAVTGVAGPGGSETHPPGLVHIAAAAKSLTLNELCRFPNKGRGEVRAETVIAGFALLHKILDKAR